MTQEIQYFILLIALLLVPKILLRFRIPSGLTAIAMGLGSAIFLGWFKDSQLVNLLSTLGITSLFLFAGLEVDYFELRKDLKTIGKHIGKAFLIILIVSLIAMKVFDLGFRPATILALGLLTPSTGFILNSLSNFKFSEDQRYWISTKAIANEVLAILVMFFALQSDSLGNLGGSFSLLLLMIIVLPVLFRLFLNLVAPFAPDSEVTFLVLLAFICGVLTREMGTYYLVGAFVVGVVAAQFRHFVITDHSEKMLYAVGFISSLFIPFYFFKSGVALGESSLSWMGLAYGAAFCAIFIPFRYGSTILSIHLFLKEYWEDRKKISVSLMPTLIFGLVMAAILKTRFNVNDNIVIGLIIYTIASSVFPTLILEKAPPEEYDSHFILSRKGRMNSKS